MAPPTYTEPELAGIIADVTGFVRKERERFASVATSLRPAERAVFAPFGSPVLLDSVRVAEPQALGLYNPAFVYRARQRGFTHMPDFVHQAELTFGEIIVLQDRGNLRLLFHGLVHVAQYHLLGIDRYTEAYVRAFVRSGLHVTIPFEVHAFDLDRRFTASPQSPFSIEDEVNFWLADGRYGV